MRLNLLLTFCLMIVAGVLGGATALAQDQGDSSTLPSRHLAVRTEAVLVIPASNSTDPVRSVRLAGSGGAEVHRHHIALFFDVLKTDSDEVVGSAVVRWNNPMPINRRGQFETRGLATVTVDNVTYQIPLKLSGKAMLVQPNPTDPAATDAGTPPTPARLWVIRGQYQGREASDATAANRAVFLRGLFNGREVPVTDGGGVTAE